MRNKGVDGQMMGGEQGVPIDQVEQEIAEFEQQLGGMEQGQVPQQPQQPMQGGMYA